MQSGILGITKGGKRRRKGVARHKCRGKQKRFATKEDIMQQPKLTLHPLTDEDLPLLETWLRRPHVLKWYEDTDKSIMRALIEKFGGGPVGLNTIATAVGEDAGTIEEVYEPFLIKEGFLKRTPRGREATELAYRHLGVTPPGNPETLLF